MCPLALGLAMPPVSWDVETINAGVRQTELKPGLPLERDCELTGRLTSQTSAVSFAGWREGRLHHTRWKLPGGLDDTEDKVSSKWSRGWEAF